MPNSTCSIDACDRPVLARTWCSAHYRRWQRTGSLETTRFITRPCSIGGCEAVAEKRGWCNTHYRRWARGGDPRPDVPLRKVNVPLVDGQKPCSACGLTKPIADFAEYNTCRSCKKEYQASWASRHPDYWLTWQRANPDKLGAIAHRRRAQKLGRDSERVDRSVVFERDGFICQLCNLPILMAEKFPHPFSPSLDHIIPLNKGGHHLYSNIQAAHFVCNSAKGDRLT